MAKVKKKIGITKQRKYNLDIDKLTFRRAIMSKQAKTLTANEFRRVLDYIATRKHADRNRAIVLTCYYAGLRVKECSSLRYIDVLDSENKVRSEIRLDAEQTKGRYGRVVFVSDKLRKELQNYISKVPYTNINDKLFYSQKRKAEGWDSNTMCQYFYYLFKNTGIEGASSHSPRRSFITNLAEKGVSVRVLMSLAGHRNISTTQAYIDVNDAMKRKAVELI
jgi:integrase/recombinase XerD